MTTLRNRSRVASFVIAILLLLPISSAVAGAAPKPKHHGGGGDVIVTFTKWITTYPAMAGFVGGDVRGVFVGEVLDRKVSTNPLLTSGMIRLEAIYEVQAGRHSFTALIQGGENAVTGAAVLDGVILAGWRTGELVHVEFQQKADCPGAPAGACFQGTIQIERDSDD